MWRHAPSSNPGKTTLQGAAYEKAIEEHHHHANVSAAVQEYVKLETRRVPSPCDVVHYDAAAELLTRYELLPDDAKTPAAGDIVAHRLVTCACQMGDQTVGNADMAAYLLEEASIIASSPSVRATAKSHADRLHRELARTMEPAQSLRHLVALSDDAQAQDQALIVLESLGDAPERWLEAEESIGEVDPRS